MELLLIRHAQSVNNVRPLAKRVADPGLTTTGHQQALRLGRRLASMNIRRIVCSPFLRALETAELVRHESGMFPEVWVDLHERGGCVTPADKRPASGMTRSQIAKRFPAFIQDGEIDERGWWYKRNHESPELAAVRANRLLVRTHREFSEKDARVAYILHNDIERLFVGCAVPGCRALDRPGNASVTKLIVTADVNRVVYYGDSSHLPLQYTSQ